LVSTAISNVSFTGGVFTLDLNVKNNSTSSYVPLVELSVVKITSASGTVSVQNADNGGNGTSISNAAMFGYSNLLGSDQIFSPAEITGSRTLRFNDSAAELFNFDVAVTAFQRTGSAGGGSAQGGSAGGGGSSSGSAQSGVNVQSVMRVLRITVNPLTRSTSVALL